MDYGKVYQEFEPGMTPIKVWFSQEKYKSWWHDYLILPVRYDGNFQAALVLKWNYHTKKHSCCGIFTNTEEALDFLRNLNKQQGGECFIYVRL